MPRKPSYFFFHYTARLLGSFLFPMFSGFGESEFRRSEGKIIFARHFGFISWLNVLRFFRTPVCIIARESMCSNAVTKLLQSGGLSILKVSDQADAESIFDLIATRSDQTEIPLFFVSAETGKIDEELISKFSSDQTLFFAVSGCKKTFSLQFIPEVHEMKALCTSLPAFGDSADQFAGIKSLEFLEHSLEITPQFELPTFFHTHQKFS